jgi:hypothetical protein
MNIDKLNLNTTLEGAPRVNQIMEKLVDGTNILPKPITYVNIDTAMTDFVSNRFKVLFGEHEIKTFFFAQQRMSEFTKTWEMVDENKNILPNFKIVTRENNPKPGTLYDGMSNIPGEPYFEVGTFNKWSGNKNITVTCKMKQPYCVDIIYNIKFVTNRLTLLNELNNNVINEFKAKQSYLYVNGHYMPVTLEDIGDESEYDLDERKIFVQNFQLKVAGYIINEEDIIFEENMVGTLIDIEIEQLKPGLNAVKDGKNLVIDFPRKSKTFSTIKSDGYYHIIGVGISNSNISSFYIKVNDSLVSNFEDFYLEKYDKVLISIDRIKRNEASKITLIVE